MLHFLEKGVLLTIAFRSWELIQWATLPENTSQLIWPTKTSNTLERPRFIIFRLQTARLDSKTKYSTEFDHCDIYHVRLYLNDEQYPYEDLNLDWKNQKVAVLFGMYESFRGSYYNVNDNKTLFTRTQFEDIAPIVVIDLAVKRTTKTHPMKENFIFIDIQGFNVKNRFIPREIALLDQEFEEVLSESRILNYTVKPPYESKNLTTKDMDNVLHATDYKRGLLWTDGEIDWQDHLQQLERAIEEAHLIFRMCYVYVNPDNTKYFLKKRFPNFSNKNLITG
ncbi:hypothetical protein QAD02_002447 [Eretmocerus hayati]|uniref:Uncharacterized protein n=1 Tax=Eretmocerus hayati TaxID=131215 RepID=A0ACC2NJV7_9HYME|nr:hypothetical protein QAD02_002447 [Eretmocerus hayati]